MDIIDKLIQQNPDFQDSYNSHYKTYVRNLQEEKKSSLKENEWWKEYVEDSYEEINLNSNVKWKLFCDSLIVFFTKFEENYLLLQKIFWEIEEYLSIANDEESTRVEVLLFETLNKNPILDKLAFSLMGEKSKLLRGRNNQFWEKVKTDSIAGALRLHATIEKLPQRQFHIFKAEQGIASLQNWLKNHSTTKPGDRAAAENIIKDLNDSLKKL